MSFSLPVSKKFIISTVLPLWLENQIPLHKINLVVNSLGIWRQRIPYKDDNIILNCRPIRNFFETTIVT